MQPPFTITQYILNKVTEISILLGKYEALHSPVPQPKLRRQNKIKTIQSSLAIEGNTLSLDQVTALFDQKRVVGPKKDILEVQNAIRLYESIGRFQSTSVKDLLKAHSILMHGLSPEAGKFRAGAVAVLKGDKVSHIAPSAKQVAHLMSDLFQFLKTEKELSPLIKACIFHYELEFIHPFADGNGRIGRFWQSLILTKWNSAFEYLPIETLVRSRQDDYYRALEVSDKSGNSTAFIEFSLETLTDALREFMDQLQPPTETAESRLQTAKQEFSTEKFSRRDYMKLFKSISSATASRDLAYGVTEKMLTRFGMKATTKYRF
jgi:Fic family protein